MIAEMGAVIAARRAGVVVVDNERWGGAEETLGASRAMFPEVGAVLGAVGGSSSFLVEQKETPGGWDGVPPKGGEHPTHHQIWRSGYKTHPTHPIPSPMQ